MESWHDQQERVRIPTRHCRMHNRIEAVMAHAESYWFRGVTRLARDIGVSHSTVSRLLRGKSNPSFVLVARLCQVLGKRLGRPIDLREVVSLDGQYPTPSVCRLCGCSGCQITTPTSATDALEPAYVRIRQGQWSFSRLE